MIIYNTTYHVPLADARDFVIWVSQAVLPRLGQTSYVSSARLSRILSHRDDESECFALQFEVESTARLHYWLIHEGKQIDNELAKTFNTRILGFATMMEEVETIKAAN